MMTRYRTLLVLVVGLFLMGMSTGCRLCCAPYDYCGPVYSGGQCSNLARHRCGSGITNAGAAGGCAKCGGGQTMMVPAQGMPTATPQQVVAPQATAQQPMAPQQIPAAQPQARNFQPINRQVPPAAQQAQYLTTSGAQSAPAVQSSGIAVNADGYQKIQVFDERGNLLGYETIDASGKSINQVPAPASAQ